MAQNDMIEILGISLESVQELDGLFRQYQQTLADGTLNSLTSLTFFLMPAQFITGLYGITLFFVASATASLFP
jgi:hypothetical protein